MGVFKEKGEGHRVTSLGFTDLLWEEEFKCRNLPWGTEILVYMNSLRTEKGAGDRKMGEGQRDLASEAPPMSFGSKYSACQGSIVLGCNVLSPDTSWGTVRI